MATYPICPKLTVLNFCHAPAMLRVEIIEFVRQCPRLQRLGVSAKIGDEGLGVVASTCKDLQELSVFQCKFRFLGATTVTEKGLVAISIGCPKLTSLVYFCHRMTNAALVTVAKNCPHFTSFHLCSISLHNPDPLTNQPLDVGFGAVVQSCKNLRRLSMSGLLTDRVFLYIGMYAERLEMLSVAFVGYSDQGMLHVLKGCRNLRKLEIRDSPFGDAAVLEDVAKHETMRSLWMPSCSTTLGRCRSLAAKMPRLNVEVMEGRRRMEEDADPVGHVYMYRTVAGPRDDAPDFVWKL